MRRNGGQVFADRLAEMNQDLFREVDRDLPQALPLAREMAASVPARIPYDPPNMTRAEWFAEYCHDNEPEIWAAHERAQDALMADFGAQYWQHERDALA